MSDRSLASFMATAAIVLMVCLGAYARTCEPEPGVSLCMGSKLWWGYAR